MANRSSISASVLSLCLLNCLAFSPCLAAGDQEAKTQGTHFSKQKLNFSKVKFGFLKQKGFGFSKHQYAPPPPVQLYVPPQVGSLQANDTIAIAGDSVTYLGFQPGGWVALWQQYVQTYYPSMNLQFYNYGLPSDHSADLLTRFSTVLQNNPTVVMIFIGLNDAGYTTSYLPQQSANIQAMINQCKATPSVRTVVIVSPFCYGEQFDGQNFFDVTLDAMLQSQANVAAQNNCPFINLRALWSTAEYVYNHGDVSSGILTEGPPGVHPNTLGAQLISGAMIKSFGE